MTTLPEYRAPRSALRRMLGASFRQAARTPRCPAPRTQTRPRAARGRRRRDTPRLGMNAGDRRFLRSLRIAPDDPVEVDQEQG